MNRDFNLTATFIPTYTFSTNVDTGSLSNGVGGSVSSSYSASSFTQWGTGERYKQGTEVTLSVTTNAGYFFKDWSDGSTDSNRTFTITENTILTANFCPTTGCVYQLTVSPLTGGTVNILGANYDEGTEVTIIATPNTGYTFDRWSGDISSTSSEITLTMNSNFAITANFTEVDWLSYNFSISQYRI